MLRVDFAPRQSHLRSLVLGGGGEHGFRGRAKRRGERLHLRRAGSCRELVDVTGRGGLHRRRKGIICRWAKFTLQHSSRGNANLLETWAQSVASYQDDVPGERASGVVQDHLRWTDEAGTLGWTREGAIHGEAERGGAVGVRAVGPL